MNKITFHKDCLFNGIVTHSRTDPFIHNFSYDATYFWFDIKNFQESLLFKKNRFTMFSFYENDHGQKNIKEELFKNITKNLKYKNLRIDYIKVLCLPRILGYSFNPISVFICFNKAKKAIFVIFEVNNTFNERHSYYCRIEDKSGEFYFKKKLYVSPFFKVQGYYKIKLKIINEKIFLKIDYEVKKKKIFSANFSGKAMELNYKNLMKIFFMKMLQNIKITSGIYFQALKLFIKGAKYIKKPIKPINDFTTIK